MLKYSRILRGLLVFILFCCFTGFVLAAEKKEDAGKAEPAKEKAQEEAKGKLPKSSAVMKEVQGEVTWVGKDRIAVVYSRNDEGASEEEILLPLAKGATFKNKKMLKEIQAGDTVRITYEEVTQTDAETKVSREAKEITFIRAAAKQPQSDVLGSQ
jgi:hypothetical protein